MALQSNGIDKDMQRRERLQRLRDSFSKRSLDHALASMPKDRKSQMADHQSRCESQSLHSSWHRQASNNQDLVGTCVKKFVMDKAVQEERMSDDGFQLRPSSSALSRNQRHQQTDLLTSVLRRLGQLEANQSEIKARLTKTQDKTLSERRQGKTQANDTADSLTIENMRLKEQIDEMEGFLASMGLVWVGKDKGRNSNSQVIDPRTLYSGLEELNAIAGENRAEIVPTSPGSKVHELGFQDRVPLQVYKNGIMIRNGPFRPYSHPLCKSFVKDVNDGYFPSEFREEFPHGVIFDLTNRMHETYDVESCGTKTSLAKCLKSVKKTVIRNGQIIHVRKGLEEFVHGHSNAENAGSKPKQVASTNPEQCTVCIRGIPFLDSSHLRLECHKSKTLQHFMDKLARQIPKLKDQKYKLVVAGKEYHGKHESRTLQELGWHPRVTLHFHLSNE